MRFASFAILLLLVIPVTLASAMEERRLERRYEAPVYGFPPTPSTPSCWATPDGRGEGVGGACWYLDGAPATVEITLVDDTFGALPTRVYVDLADHRIQEHAFCGTATIDLPDGAGFLAVFVDAWTPARVPCGLNVHGLHTTGTVTVTWR